MCWIARRTSTIAPRSSIPSRLTSWACRVGPYLGCVDHAARTAMRSPASARRAGRPAAHPAARHRRRCARAQATTRRAARGSGRRRVRHGTCPRLRGRGDRRAPPGQYRGRGCGRSAPHRADSAQAWIPRDEAPAGARADGEQPVGDAIRRSRPQRRCYGREPELRLRRGRLRCAAPRRMRRASRSARGSPPHRNPAPCLARGDRSPPFADVERRVRIRPGLLEISHALLPFPPRGAAC